MHRFNGLGRRKSRKGFPIRRGQWRGKIPEWQPPTVHRSLGCTKPRPFVPADGQWLAFRHPLPCTDHSHRRRPALPAPSGAEWLTEKVDPLSENSGKVCETFSRAARRITR